MVERDLGEVGRVHGAVGGIQFNKVYAANHQNLSILSFHFSIFIVSTS